MTNKIMTREEISNNDKWDLTSLFTSKEDWEKSFESISVLVTDIVCYQGKIKSSADNLLQVLKLYEELEKRMELLGSYAFLQNASDKGNSEFEVLVGRISSLSLDVESKICFIITEIQDIPETDLRKWIEREDFKNYKIFIQKLLHNKPYILSEKEEKLLALQAEVARTPDEAFSKLTNVDINYGSINVNNEEFPLTQSTWSIFMESDDRNTRKTAYKQFYKNFDSHKNTIAALYNGNVQQDVFESKARGYKSSLEMALFPNNVPISVYTNLIQTVHENLDSLHKYYDIRKRVLKLDELRHYDVYTPLCANVKKTTTYNDAVEIIRNALAPLGKDYTDTLCKGLVSGWVDKYENKGKRSGAFSAGAYSGYPYILLNYKQDVLRDVFTIAHEGGHSMHSYYSAKSNPFLCYNYTIFEAEVASTFNEELLFNYLLKNTDDKQLKAYLLSTRVADIMATLHRQTMFAEFELKSHELVEKGYPLSSDILRQEYRKLLELYFGPKMVFEEESDLECLRIPHFYNSFYVYKYATGISAALALADRVLNGGKTELNDYYNFLKSGGSRFPIDSLKIAGVDMSSVEPIKAALNRFSSLVDQMDKLLD